MIRRILQQFASAILIIILSVSGFAGDYHVELQPVVIEKTIQIEQKGILKQKDNGYLYLEVSDDFISEILPLIVAPGKIVPPHHYTSKKGIGAHISVMYESEQIAHEIWEIEELGNEYRFTITELRTVKITKNNQVEKLWLLAVEAPELESLREKYGLSSKLKGHDFHITIGSQVPGKKNNPEIKEAA